MVDYTYNGYLLLNTLVFILLWITGWQIFEQILEWVRPSSWHKMIIYSVIFIACCVVILFAGSNIFPGAPVVNN